MKLTMPRDVLAAVTGWVTATTSTGLSGPLTPVLAGVMLTATADGTLTAARFGYEASASATAAAEVGEPGRVLTPAKMLAAVLTALPARQPVDVTLAGDGSRVLIAAGALTYTLLALPADDYPDLPAPGEHAAEFDAGALGAAVAATTVAAGKDDTLPALTCVRLTLSGAGADGEGIAMLAATDRYRMATAGCAYTAGPADTPATVLIPARDLAAALKHPGDAPVRLALTSDTAAFTTADRHVTVRLISAEYPDVTRHVPDPKTVTATVTADVAALAAALRRAAVVADHDTPARLAFTADAVRIESGSGDDASYTETVPAALDGDPLHIAFKPGYLLDALTAIPATGSTAARIAMTTPVKPAAITPAAPTGGPAGLTYVVMPVKHTG